jgi:hypothetical protein
MLSECGARRGAPVLFCMGALMVHLHVAWYTYDDGRVVVRPTKRVAKRRFIRLWEEYG